MHVADLIHPEEKALADGIRPWLQRARGMIDRRFADARSHAANAKLTEAHARLDELNRGLAEHVSDARAAFYRDAFAWHRQRLDPEIHLMDERPYPDGEVVVRLAKIGGRDVYADLIRLVNRAKMALAVAANAAADERVSPDLRDTMLSAWEVTHRDGVHHFVRGALSDSQITLHNAIGHVLIRPELR